MGTPTHLRMLLLALAIMMSLAVRITSTDVVANFVGSVECIDCLEKNIKKENAVQGLGVNIKCKVDKENYETKATGNLDSQGNFIMELPKQLVDNDGKLKQECFAELQSAASTPCTDKTSSSKIILKSKQEGKHTFVAESGKMHFSSATCVSAFFWPHHKQLPWYKPLPKLHPFLHKHYYPTPVPVHKPPVYHSPTPVYTPPVYKPPVYAPPVYKPPVYTPPVYNPPAYTPPVYKPPVYTPPVYNPPVYKPPVYIPPVHEHPIYEKPPCPPISVPIYKKPFPFIHKKPLPQLPPLHSHPKYQWPHLPPYSPHPWKKDFGHKHPIFPPVKVHA